LQQYRDVCKKCGAVRVDEQIGLEETPEAYVEKLVSVFREVRRVLADDGTLWLNLASSYAGSGKGIGDSKSNNKSNGSSRGVKIGSAHGDSGHTSGVTPPPGYKAKDLIGIPWMTAFALRADGWYLRSEIIWHKSNPMPESVTDRPTKAHEQLFLLSKSPRYYYDAKAILEPLTDTSVSRLSQDVQNQKGSARANGGAKTNGNMKAVHKNLLPDGQRPHSMHLARAEHAKLKGTGQAFGGDGHSGYYDADGNLLVNPNGRNKRTVWTVATQPYSGAHFATYPPALIEPCIKAGCPEGGIVLDPFSGSGTTAMVARRLGRRAVGLDLNFAYIQDCARPRLQLDALEDFQNGKKAESNYFDLPLFAEKP
jgi:DNA modification methylase